MRLAQRTEARWFQTRVIEMKFTYRLPDELAVEIDGPIRRVDMSRPAKLNAIDPGLDCGWPRFSWQLESGA